MLKADGFFNDPRIQEAKRLIFAALQDAKASFHGVEGPKSEYKMSYQVLIDDFSRIRGFPLFYPYVGSGLGSGPLVELMDGSCKYDMISGIGVHYFGHSAEPLISSSIDAALSDTVMQGNLQQNKDALDLAKLVTEASGFDHCFLSSSGAMACENCLKIAFQKNFPATRILAFERAFAGRTLTLSHVTDKPSFRVGLPASIPVDYVPFFDARDPHGSITQAINVLKAHIRRYPKQHAVMCMELVQGEGGFWPGSSGFFKALVTILHQAGIAVWADEIQTFARTEKLFAFQHFDLEGLVDLVTIGKVTPACATLYTKEYCPKPGLLSQTFTASTSAIHASKWLIEHVLANSFFGQNGKIAQIFHSITLRLAKLHEKYGCVHGPYGIGSMIAFTPFDGEEERVKAFVQKLFHNGVISFIAGSNPTRVRFLPPVGVLTDAHLDPIFQIIEQTIRESMP